MYFGSTPITFEVTKHKKRLSLQHSIFLITICIVISLFL